MTLFTDGEPLDVSVLNKMASDIDNLKAQLSIMTNRFDAANKNKIPTIPVIETGSVRVNMDKAGTIIEDIDFNSTGSFDTDEKPKIIASPRNKFNTGQYVSIAITNTNPPKLSITSNGKLSNYLIDWVAIYQREVPPLA